MGRSGRRKLEDQAGPVPAGEFRHPFQVRLVVFLLSGLQAAETRVHESSEIQAPTSGNQIPEGMP